MLDTSSDTEHVSDIRGQSCVTPIGLFVILFLLELKEEFRSNHNNWLLSIELRPL